MLGVSRQVGHFMPHRIVHKGLTVLDQENRIELNVVLCEIRLSCSLASKVKAHRRHGQRYSRSAVQVHALSNALPAQQF